MKYYSSARIIRLSLYGCILILCSCTQKLIPVEYALLTPVEFRERLAAAPVAYLPLGTLEWHSEHLPLGADGLQSSAFFNELARESGGIVLPMLFLGPDQVMQEDQNTYYGMDFWYDSESMKKPVPSKLDGSAYWVSDSLYSQIVEATLAQLSRAGFKIVVAHGHGPSTGQYVSRFAEWEKKYNLKLLSCRFEGATAETGLMNDHAAQNETSILMHYYPELVKMDQLPSDTSVELRGVLGKDPRTYASRKLGKDIAESNLKRMKEIIKTELEKIK